MANIAEVLIKIGELDWNVTESMCDDTVCIGKFSPADQDFSIEITKVDNVREFIEQIYNAYDSYDPSYEASLWLDSTGHGTNGAPYNMKDLYEDMEWCQNSLKELYTTLYNEFCKS